MRYACLPPALILSTLIVLFIGGNAFSADTHALSNKENGENKAERPASASDPLWRKAVALAEKNRKWVPGTIRTSETVKDKKGVDVETTSRVVTSKAGPGKAVSWTLVELMENGADTTEDNHEDLEEYITELFQEADNNNPFLGTEQNRIQVIPLDTIKTIDGETCREFSYIHTMDGVAMKGRAWLRREDGLPIKIRLGINEPIKDKEATITKYQMTVQFAPCTPERWYPREVKMETAFRLKMFPFMGWQGTSLENITFEDHWLPGKQK